jgi:hypothetical protein
MGTRTERSPPATARVAARSSPSGPVIDRVISSVT